jgi:hypothetical protein
MSRLYCLLCDHESEGSDIVSHVKTHGTLEDYFTQFPNAPVVDTELEHAVMAECDCPGLSEEDRVTIARAIVLKAPFRSEILIK